MDPIPIKENTTFMPTTPMEQNNPASNVITTSLMKFQQPSSTLLANILHSNTLELEDPPTQIKVAMNAEEEAEWRHLLKEVLPTIAQDSCMIHLLGWQEYINIVKTMATRWVEGVSLFFLSFLFSMNLLVSMVIICRKILFYVGFKMALGVYGFMFHF